MLLSHGLKVDWGCGTRLGECVWSQTLLGLCHRLYLDSLRLLGFFARLLGVLVDEIIRCVILDNLQVRRPIWDLLNELLHWSRVIFDEISTFHISV